MGNPYDVVFLDEMVKVQRAAARVGLTNAVYQVPSVHHIAVTGAVEKLRKVRAECKNIKGLRYLGSRIDGNKGVLWLEVDPRPETYPDDLREEET